MTRTIADPSPRASFTSERSAPWRAIERLRQMRAAYRNWPAAIANRTYRHDALAVDIVRVRSDTRLLNLIVRRNKYDIRALNENWIGRVYDRWIPGGTEFDAVIDLGANCGYFTVISAEVLSANITLAVEPAPDNASILATNLELNGLGGTTRLLQAAVTSDPEHTSVDLHLSSDPRLNSLEFGGRRGEIVKTITVPGRSLSSIVAEVPRQHRITLLKVDIEGSEWSVLATLTATDAARIDAIVIESDDAPPEDLVEVLSSRGLSMDVDVPFYAFRRISGP